jgi:hypothetical protein
MGVLDRDYTKDKDAANKPRWADVAVPLDVLRREKRTKRLNALVWGLLVIGLLAAAMHDLIVFMANSFIRPTD